MTSDRELAWIKADFLLPIPEGGQWIIFGLPTTQRLRACALEL